MTAAGHGTGSRLLPLGPRALAALGAAIALVFTPGCGFLITNTVLFFALSTESDEVQEFPVVSSVRPTLGPVEGGTLVTVYGQWFKPGCEVLFGDAPGTQVRVLSPSELTCRSPAWLGQKRVGVLVRNQDGHTGDQAEAFSYWWDGDWPRRMRITVAGTTAGELLEYQETATVPYDPEMRTDFGDLRCTFLEGASEVPIPYWVESSTASTQAKIWFRVPRIPAAPGEATVFAYFGNPAATSVSDFGATFTKDFGDAGCVGLWHLDEGSGSSAADGTGSGNTGMLANFFSSGGWLPQDGGGWGSTPGVGFPTGSALRFDGADDLVDCGSSPTLSVLLAASVESWIQPSAGPLHGSDRTVLAKWQVCEDFALSAAWTAFDPGAAALDVQGKDPDGYRGAAFDGRYVYFAPHHNGTQYHALVLRYDTAAGFASSSSWAAYDPGAAGLAGVNPGGYCGATFDGRYVYFVPFRRNTGPSTTEYHGEVLRYDTRASFQSLSSWAAFDPGPGTGGLDAGGHDPDGFQGAVFDGRYVFFVPFYNETAYSAEVLRYDTQSAFDALASWEAYTPAGAAGGYAGGLFDGRYVYFVPSRNGAGYHGEVMRLDTQADFLTAGSWSRFDPGPGTGGLDSQGFSPDGYAGAAFDGRFVYFAPQFNGSVCHGEVLRYDTLNAFNALGSWTVFDPGAAGFDLLGWSPDGFSGAVFDGRYVTFIPFKRVMSPPASNGQVLRYDTTAPFASLSSWTILDAGPLWLESQGFNPEGFWGGAFDGRFLYLAPESRNFNPVAEDAHGEVLRYDTTGNGASYRLSLTGGNLDGAFSGGPFGVRGEINTDVGHFAVFSSAGGLAPAAGDWTHAAMSFDGTSLALYVNGAPAASAPASGFFVSATAPVTIGAFYPGRGCFLGDIDEARVYSRTLPAAEVRAHAERRRFAYPPPVVSGPAPKEGP